MATTLSPRNGCALWARSYDRDEMEYEDLISRHTALSAQDFEKIGQWKDAALKEGKAVTGKWKPNVASVAYAIWMQAASELPKSPSDPHGAAKFLQDWSERKYTDTYKDGGRREKRFGLSRASTLLHFVSGARYPIFDSRVKTALEDLTAGSLDNTVEVYLETVCPVVAEIEKQCQAKPRSVDNALFEYGAWLASKKRAELALQKAARKNS